MNVRKISLALLFLPLSLMAQTNLGYTNETATRNNIFRYTSNTDQRLAMRLSPEKIQLLKGKTIKAIRIAFGSKNSTNAQAKLFLTTDLTASPISEEIVSVTSTNKLMEYPLSKPYTITGQEKKLYVGCSMEIASNYGPFSSDFSKDIEGVFFAYGNGGWHDLYGTGYGCPNIEIVTSESMAFTDICLKSFKEDGYVKQGTQLSYKLQLQNFGTTPIQSFDAVVKVGDGVEKVFSFSGLNIESHKTYDFSISDFASQETGSQDIQVQLTRINGGMDDEVSDNVSTAHAYFYPADMQKNILLEVFTGQTCVNCPTGHESLASTMKQVADIPVVEIAHHAGYVTDIFSMKEDWTLTGLYNGSTYAPAAMFNRMSMSAEASPVNECSSISSDVTYLKKANQQRPYVSIGLKSNYDAKTREVKLNCSFYTHEEMPGEETHYSIWLVQDQIVAAQKGATGDYVHTAVSRGCLTESAWGEKATFVPGETLQIEKSFTLPEIIASTSYEKDDQKNEIPTVLKNMKVVVFVHQQSKNDITACQVFNCAEIALDTKNDVSSSVRVLQRQTYYGDTQGTSSEDVATRIIDYGYNADNQLLRKIETSKDTDADRWLLTHYYLHDYDAEGHLLRTNSLQYGTFDYDELGWLPANDTVTFVYDEEGQLIMEAHPLKYYTYTYNAEGQRTERSTWNVNNISLQATNDLVETYSGFNSFGQPTIVTATSPTGKEWNEYKGELTYDAEGRLIAEKHYSNESPAVLTYAEYWTYQDGMLIEHRLPTVFGDGAEVENEKEVFEMVDGNKDMIAHQVFQSNGDGTWSKMSGSRCVDEYTYLTTGSAPTLHVSPYDGGINTVGLYVAGTTTQDIRFYRSGVLVEGEVREVDYDIDGNPGHGWEITDLSVKNGTYEYIALDGARISDIVEYTYAVPLPTVTDVHVVSTRKDFEGNTFVTIGWTNPSYELMPFVSLPFLSHNIYFEGMRVAEATTTDPDATQLEVNFGGEKVNTLYVQTLYTLGRSNSSAITIDVDNLSNALEEIHDETDGSPLYDLQGRRVKRAMKGIYIKQGRKVLQ